MDPHQSLFAVGLFQIGIGGVLGYAQNLVVVLALFDFAHGLQLVLVVVAAGGSAGGALLGAGGRRRRPPSGRRVAVAVGAGVATGRRRRFVAGRFGVGQIQQLCDAETEFYVFDWVNAANIRLVIRRRSSEDSHLNLMLD